LSEEAGPYEGHCVVLVDDDGVCLAMLARGLRKRGFNVAAYSDPRDAVRELRQDRPSAVITDMRMPHMSGLDVVHQVQEILGSEAPPVLVVSADGDESLLNEAFRLGASDYLLKPVSDAELGAKLEKALRTRPTHSGPPAIPERMGPWRLGECIGRGGTACVFRATRGGDSTSYALKVIWPHLTQSTETLLRFRREIDTLSTLSHPRMVRFVESGRQEEAYYYVMDHLPAGTLRERIRRAGVCKPSEVLDLLEQVTEPLLYLHAQSIVHRDLKPSNVFYADDGSFVLGDFGLARRLQDHGITLEQEFIGTPLYLAPEVFRSRDFDHSVDFYALGVCALEMLLGGPVLTELDPMSLIGRIMERGLPHPVDLLGGDAPAPLLDLLAEIVCFDSAERLKDGEEIRARSNALR
jgi:CheY-like chemotaxis protein